MSIQSIRMSASLKSKMKSFTEMVTAENANRYNYIEMLQDQYGQFLMEESKTPHYCDICKVNILGKAFGPHKKSHYKRKQHNNNAILQEKDQNNQKNIIRGITNTLKE